MDEIFGLTEEEAVKLEEEGKNNFLVPTSALNI